MGHEDLRGKENIPWSEMPATLELAASTKQGMEYRATLEGQA